MKQSIIYTLVAVILTAYGCNDMLNQSPQGELTTATNFVTPDDAFSGLMATYHTAQISSNSNFHIWAFGNVTSDDAVKGGESGADQASIQRLSYFNISTTNDKLTPIWNYSYQGVHRANLVIEGVPGIEGLGEDEANRYIAEAKFMRAFFYYRLTKIFGRLPLVKKASPKSYEIPRSSLDSTYTFIENNLEDAAAVLPPKSKIAKDQLGRATRGAAKALLARVHLMQSEFTEAQKWAGEVIKSNEYSLNPDYSNIFRVSNEHGSGTIFAINYGYNSLYQYQDYGNQADIYKGSRGFYGYGFNLPTQDLHDAFNPNDPRLNATMFSNGDKLEDGRTGDVGNSKTGYIDGKAYLYKDEVPPNFYDSPRDNIIIRLGELKLWYAEAANENKNTQTALDALNSVRKRAREGDASILPDITVTGQDELRQAIWKEQRVEYALESKRFFDLVRTDRAADVLHSFAQKYNTQKGANFKKGRNEVFPIPQTQIDLSDGTLKQNDNY